MQLRYGGMSSAPDSRGVTVGIGKRGARFWPVAKIFLKRKASNTSMAQHA